MFNPTQLVIDNFVERLVQRYHGMYGLHEPELPNIIAFCGRMALENIANTDALYHDFEHTIVVTEVGQEIVRGKHLIAGGVDPRDWFHFVIALLCHDIGYVRGVCRGDGDGHYVIGAGGQTVELPPGSTDAALTPYHAFRSQQFVRERFGKVRGIDADTICAHIEDTKFPVPDSQDTADGGYAGLLRAADLIGQMADNAYLSKLPALFGELEETGTSTALGYAHPDDLRTAYPILFWNVASPLIEEALAFLEVTQEGKLWVANLRSHVFEGEHSRGQAAVPAS